MFNGPQTRTVMSRSFVIGLFVLLMGEVCPAAYAYVMGQDDRQEINQAESQQPEIMQTGIIQIGDGSFVTGVLTGDNCDVVISAGHAAIYWQSNAMKGWHRGELRGGGKFQFYPDPGRNREGP